MPIKVIGFDGSLKGVPYSLPTSDGSDGQVLSTNGSGTVAFQNVTSNSFFTFGLSTSERDITSEVDMVGSGGSTIFFFPFDCRIVGASASVNVTAHTTGRTIRFYIYKNGSSQTFVTVSPSGTGISSTTTSLTPITFSSGDAIGISVAHSGIGETTENHAITLQVEI